jgi:hypothetical protein
MLVAVFAVCLGLVAILLVDPLRQRLFRSRSRRWKSYYRN